MPEAVWSKRIGRFQVFWQKEKSKDFFYLCSGKDFFLIRISKLNMCVHK